MGPTPSPAGECAPLSLGFREGGHTRMRERGWGVSIRTKGQKLWYSRHNVLCACPCPPPSQEASILFCNGAQISVLGIHTVHVISHVILYTNILYTWQSLYELSLYGTEFIRDKVYTGQSLYRDKFYTRTKFIRGQSLYGTKFIQWQSLYEDKVYTTFFILY
jgi:hypothetical protein